MGPPPDNRKQTLEADLVLGPSHAGIPGFRSVLGIHLDWEGIDTPRAHLLACIAKLAGDGREDLATLCGRAGHAIPADRLWCRSIVPDAAGTRPAHGLPPEELVACCMVLGLCTEHIYDPARAPLWTQHRLARAVELYRPEGYATPAPRR